MQAIQTRYLGPTNSRGARIKAWALAGSITVAYDYALSAEECHRKAAEDLTVKLQWHTPSYGNLLGSTLPNGDGVFVFNNKVTQGVL